MSFVVPKGLQNDTVSLVQSLEEDPLMAIQFPAEFLKGDRVTFIGKKGSRISAKVLDTNYDKKRGIWEYQIRDGGTDQWVPERNLRFA